jgi:hypothetical protein
MRFSSPEYRRVIGIMWHLDSESIFPALQGITLLIYEPDVAVKHQACSSYRLGLEFH